MHPKPMRQQITQHKGNQQATAMRKNPGFQRAQTRATMTTEYQERFLPPCRQATVIATTRQIDPYHPQKKPNYEVTALRSYYVTHKWIQNPPKAPQPSVPPKGQGRCSSAPHNPSSFVPNKNDYTSVYQNDFRAWKANKRWPYKLHDCLKVNQGLVVTSSSSKEGRSQKSFARVADNSKAVPQVQKPPPIESITSYRSEYVPHPLQPRPLRRNPVYQSNKDLLVEPAVSLRPEVTWDIHQKLFDGANEFLHQFKTWSLETKFHGQGKAKESGPSADHIKFLSTTHADYTVHKCQHTKPALLYSRTGEKSKKPFQATTTMKEDNKAGDSPQCFPTGHKYKIDWAKEATFSACPPEPTESCKTNPNPFSLHPKRNQTVVCNSCFDATDKPQCPSETFNASPPKNPGGTGLPLWTEE